jgi:prepilin-type N-terminal cleavage/methylation domain-containing protein
VAGVEVRLPSRVAAAAVGPKHSNPPVDAPTVTAATVVATVSAAKISERKSWVNPAPGFTLLELLVALTILVVVVLLLMQTIGGTSSASSSMRRRLEMDAEARAAFDRMQSDISSMVIRPDVDALFLGLPQDGGGGIDRNDQFYFYSQAPGYSSATTGVSPFSIVAYTVTNQQLMRLGMAKSWDDIPFLTTNVTVTGLDPATLQQCLGIATNYWHSIGPSVFRMEIGLMMKPGTTNADGTVNAANSYAYLGNPSNPRHGMANVASIVVALGLLDFESRQLVTTQQLSNMGTLLADCMTNGGIPMNAWETNLAVTNGTTPVLANRARLYIRNFPLKR